MSTLSSPPPAATPPISPGAIPAAPASWPAVFGVIAIIFGAFGILLNAWGAIGPLFVGFLRTLPGQSQEIIDAITAYAVATSIYSIVAALLSAALLIGGILLVKRRPVSIRVLNFWAIAKLLLVPVGAVVTWLTQRAQFDAMGRDPQMQGNPVFNTGVEDIMLAGTAVFTLLWGWALPIIILWWFARRATKDEIGRWT